MSYKSGDCTGHGADGGWGSVQDALHGDPHDLGAGTERSGVKGLHDTISNYKAHANDSPTAIAAAAAT